MKVVNLVFFLAIFFCGHLRGAEGYQIKVTIDDYDETELYLAVYYGDKQYLVDTATVNEQREYIFKDEEALEGGVYMVILAPEKKHWFQLLITDGDQHFDVHTKAGRNKRQ